MALMTGASNHRIKLGLVKVTCLYLNQKYKQFPLISRHSINSAFFSINKATVVIFFKEKGNTSLGAETFCVWRGRRKLQQSHLDFNMSVLTANTILKKPNMGKADAFY